MRSCVNSCAGAVEQLNDRYRTAKAMRALAPSSLGVPPVAPGEVIAPLGPPDNEGWVEIAAPGGGKRGGAGALFLPLEDVDSGSVRRGMQTTRAVRVSRRGEFSG